MSSPIKYVYNRLPACVRPEKRLVRSYATNARAALVQIFFVPATMLPPVEAMVVGLDIFTKDAVPHIYLK